MADKITLLDGAMGTALWNIAEREGVAKDPVWKYNVEHPDFIAEITKQYVEAGSQIIQANTFGANKPSIKYFTDYEVEQVTRPAVQIAREAVKGTDVKVAVSVGPLTKLLKPYGDLSAEECEEIFREQIGTAALEKPDLVTMETFLDLEMIKIAAKVAKSYDLPVFCTLTFERKCRTLMGNSVKQVCKELKNLGVDAVGMNCGLGPDKANEVIEQFREYSELPVIYKPNAGMPVLNPDGSVQSAYTAEMFLEEVKPVLPYVSYMGGCCGSDPSFIATLRDYLKSQG
ncbi:MAG: homocysteine S-methyltransferase family protein [Lachnospiraceae bacterium]|nr:homocysteine S-methyltransferase family protein [Lachnospiraceae bacterium]